MNRAIYSLFSISMILGIYPGAFAQDCSVTVKCVCESQNHVRVVPCPKDFSNTAINCTKEGLPDGTCGVDCGQEVEAYCEEIPIKCKNNEIANCLATLPINVGTTPSDCAPGETDCNGECVDLNTSTDNCGACGTACQNGATCQSGACVCDLSQGLEECNGQCVDKQNDVLNCGACGNACANDEICVSGICVD